MWQNTSSNKNNTTRLLSQPIATIHYSKVSDNFIETLPCTYSYHTLNLCLSVTKSALKKLVQEVFHRFLIILPHRTPPAIFIVLKGAMNKHKRWYHGRQHSQTCTELGVRLFSDQPIYYLCPPRPRNTSKFPRLVSSYI